MAAAAAKAAKAAAAEAAEEAAAKAKAAKAAAKAAKAAAKAAKAEAAAAAEEEAAAAEAEAAAAAAEEASAKAAAAEAAEEAAAKAKAAKTAAKAAKAAAKSAKVEAAAAAEEEAAAAEAAAAAAAAEEASAAEAEAAAAAAPIPPSLPEGFMYKNRLQEYAQKASFPLPLYQTLNVGHKHEPKFRSSVIIGGVTYRSHQTFLRKKEAEQDVAKIALEGIPRENNISLIYENPVYCKSILHEYAVKMNLEPPQYTTSQVEGIPIKFMSSVVFSGETYTSGSGKNKKEAEQIAARTVVETILENINTRTLMSRILKSKVILHAATHKGNTSGASQQGMLPLKMQSENSPGSIQQKEMQVKMRNADLVDKHVAYAKAGQSSDANKAPWFPGEYVSNTKSVKVESDSVDIIVDCGIKRTYEDQGAHKSKKARAERTPRTRPKP